MWLGSTRLICDSAPSFDSSLTWCVTLNFHLMRLRLTARVFPYTLVAFNLAHSRANVLHGALLQQGAVSSTPH